MYCQHCGAALEPGMRYCPGCGAPRGTGPRRPWEDERGIEPVPAPPLPQPVVYPQQIVIQQAGAGAKSYTLWAWLCLLLYIFYIPGLVANFILWRSAVNFERDTGVRAKGTGCLVWLLWVVGLGIPAIMVIGSLGGT
jgi:hypothetical protein